MAPNPVTNRFQKENFRRGERRLRWKEVQHYLKLADSEQAPDRIEAMENLCPCHVRQRIDDVWAALYRGWQDEELKVRQAAWHTWEDGGQPNDPNLYPIMVEIAKTESNPKLREQAQKIVKSVQVVEDKKQTLSKQRYHYFTGKCDWCGHSAAEVAYLYDSDIQIGATVRLAQAGDDCRSEYGL